MAATVTLDIRYEEVSQDYVFSERVELSAANSSRTVRIPMTMEEEGDLSYSGLRRYRDGGDGRRMPLDAGIIFE